MVTSTPFRSSAQVFEWISGFINLERGQTVKSFRLDRMNILADMCGGPEKCAPAIHVAGSKGKGSVTGMIASILNCSGIKTARYASPHVSDFRERLTMGNDFFSEDIYINAGNELLNLVEAIPFTREAAFFDPSNEKGEAATFFELMTLWFFLCARHSECGAMAIETGMGGRLDATNIIDPLVSVITLIELEHTEYLGNTITAIAGEKAGIIKPGKPLVLAEQSREALIVFREHAAQKNSRLLYFPDLAELENIKVTREGTRFSLSINYPEVPGSGGKTGKFPDIFVPIAGEIQAKNAGLAVLSVKTAFPEIEDRFIYEGLSRFRLPARFEKISDEPPVIIDGAHTVNSMELCLKNFTSLYGYNNILIFGCAADKDVSSMADLCLPFFSTIIITKPGNFKKSFPGEIYSVFSRHAELGNYSGDIIFLPDTKEAIEKTTELAVNKNLSILGTGSFYLAAEIRNRLLDPIEADRRD